MTASEDKSDAFDSKDNESYSNLHMIPFDLSHHIRVICSLTSYQKPITLSDCSQFKHDFTTEEKVLRDANLWHK